MINRRSKNGFTLIEALVAMMFLTLAITPAVIVSVSTLDVATRIQNDLIGALLAQEGIELVRYLRDYNWLACNDFSAGLIGGPYVIDIDTEWNACPDVLVAAGPNPVLYIDPSGVYSHDSSGALTQFRRTVSITEISADELRVVSEVYWTTKQGTTYPGCPANTRCARAESHLYNWE